jgi:hypothetical protein
VELTRNRDGVAQGAFELALDERTAVAGQPIHGHVRGLSQAASVTLLRIEECPSGTLATAIDSCRVSPANDARFELAVPDDTPARVAGRECELRYAVRAASPVSGRRRTFATLPVEVTGGERSVHEALHLFDRMIASFPARHFHIELAEAVLEGGGRIEGRVHVRDLDEPSVEVIARCDETWRTNFRVRNHRQPPLWRSRSLWSETQTVECDPGRSWHRFAFAIPPGLPTAVEGYVVCWRYEVEVRRRARTGLLERAVVTPLRFDIE